MKLLYSYLRRHWKLVALALLLATVNQVFSLMDPLIFRYVIDRYALKYDHYTTGQFFRGVGWLLAGAVGVAFVSRVAKNFQDYFLNVVTQRLGARLYADGIRHSLELPYQMFEDHSVASVRWKDCCGTPPCSRIRKPSTTSPSFSAFGCCSNVVSGEIAPDDRPAIAVTILKVEPGT